MRFFISGQGRAAVVLAVLALVAAPAGATVQFTATMIQTHQGDTVDGRFCLRGAWYRMDQEKELHEFFVLVDRCGGTSLFFSPLEKVYMEMSGDDPLSLMNDPFLSFKYAARTGELFQVGVDTLNGYVCDKYRVLQQGRDVMTQWRARKLDFPIKIVSHLDPGMFMELREIKEEPVSADLFRIPPGYQRMKRPTPRRQGIPGWVRDVMRAPIAQPPFEREMSAGEIIKVRTETGQAIRISARKAIPQKSLAVAIPFAGGTPVKNGEEPRPFAGGSFTFFESTDEADHIVIRVLEGKMAFTVRRLEMTEKRIPAGEVLHYVINPDKITEVRFVNAINGLSECEVFFFGEGEDVNEGPDRFRRITLEDKFESRHRTWQNADADEMMIRVYKGEMIIKLGRFNRHGLP